MSRKARWTITLLMGITAFRAQTILFLPKVAMFGGPVPNAWFAPLLSDAILGFLVPIMIFLFWKLKGPRIWGLLLTYNALGVFDYANGLFAQWIAPMPAEMASSMAIYVGISLFMIIQLNAVAMLLDGDVIRHFIEESIEDP